MANLVSGAAMYPLRSALVITASLAIVGCATPTKPLYDWRAYQPQVYEFFKGGSVEQQILALEEQAEKSKAAGTALPPGFRAHLGFLYSKSGNTDKMKNMKYP
jgi:hypothetical protein